MILLQLLVMQKHSSLVIEVLSAPYFFDYLAMYRGFRLDLHSSIVEDNEWLKRGRISRIVVEQAVRRNLKSFLNPNGTISGDNLMDEWFPQVEADIFISHSHADADLAQYISGYLEVQYNLKAFIDSAVWGYSANLLKEIDDAYCRQYSSGNYIYEKRNLSTSHVHMMLSVALMKMINRTECLFFLNSDKSIRPGTLINDSAKTLSPWLYSELAFSRMVEKISPERHSWVNFSESKEMQLLKSAAQLGVEYTADLSHLDTVNSDVLNEWNKDYSKNQSVHPLDLLYYRKASGKSWRLLHG